MLNRRFSLKDRKSLIESGRSSNPSSAFGGSLHHQLIHAVTEYDRKQQGKRGYNMYALPQYLNRIADVEVDIASGTPVRKALTDGFTGRLLDVVLKAVGEGKSVREEQMGGVVYKGRASNPGDFAVWSYSNAPGAKSPTVMHFSSSEAALKAANELVSYGTVKEVRVVYAPGGQALHTWKGGSWKKHNPADDSESSVQR